MVADLNLAAWAFDGFLCFLLLFSAWQLLAARDLFRAIIIFFVFGLFMSLAWVRLNAVDVALAEATIGAGLTGALFLAALARVRRTARRDSDSGSKEGRTSSGPQPPETRDR